MMTEKRQLWVNLMVLFSLMFLPFWDASAQEDAFQIFFSPEPAYINIDESISTVVTVDLANAVDIWSFDVIITYDAAVATITDYAITDWFGSLYCAKNENLSGYFRVSCASTGVPVNGDGNLFTLTFEGLNLGQTALTFDKAVFGNTNDQPVPVVSDNGELNIVPLYTDLFANLAVQGKLNRSGVNLSLAPGTTFGYRYYDRLSTDIPGNNLSIPNVVVDTYTVTASYEGCLSASGTIVVPSDTDTYNLPPLILVAGNSVSDDIINDDDIKSITDAYGNPTLNPNADVNFDGLIDARDLALAAGNFGLTSAAAYADWLP